MAKRVFNLGQEAWSGAAGALPFPLRPIPDSFMSDDYRVCWLIMQFDFDITTGAGGGFTREELLRWISNIALTAAEHSMTNLSGWDLWNFLQYVMPDLFGWALPAASVGAEQENEQYNVLLAIPIENQEAAEPQDYVVPASLFNDAELQLTLGAAALNANTTINSLTIRVFTAIDRKNEVQIPALPTIFGVTLDLYDQLPPGIYDSLLALAPGKDDDFSAAGLTNLHMTAAGEQILGAVVPDAVLAAYCFDHGAGAEAAVIGWNDNAASIQRLPFIWPANNRRSNRLTAMLDTKGTALVMNHSGTDTSIRYVGRYYKPITAEGTMHRLGKMGVAKPENVAYKPKTFSKKPLSVAQRTTRPGAAAVPWKITGARGGVSSLGRLASRFSKPMQLTAVGKKDV